MPKTKTRHLNKIILQMQLFKLDAITILNYFKVLSSINIGNSYWKSTSIQIPGKFQFYTFKA